MKKIAKPTRKRPVSKKNAIPKKTVQKMSPKSKKIVPYTNQYNKGKTIAVTKYIYPYTNQHGSKA